MPRYRVRLTREVNDTLDTIVEATARNPTAAGKAALELAAKDKVEWHFAYAGEGDTPEIDSVTKC